MLASVLIQYSVKSLNKEFDYLIPNNLIKRIRIGNKVIVPFGSSKVEGFVLNIHDNIDKSLEYREIIEIISMRIEQKLFVVSYLFKAAFKLWNACTGNCVHIAAVATL